MSADFYTRTFHLIHSESLQPLFKSWWSNCTTVDNRW